MNIEIIARTFPDTFKGGKIKNEQLKEVFDDFSAKCAGICYMPEDFETILNEPSEKTQKRIKQTKEGGHHSVYDHDSVTLYISGVPKAFCMLLNNEKQMTTSEKSGRYTLMAANGQEKEIYDKWIIILADKIKEIYGEKYPKYFTDFKVRKLAQENARMLLSVFTPGSSFAHTTTYRQINNLYAFMQIEISKKKSHVFYEKLKPYMKKFCRLIKELGLYDEDLAKNVKNRKFSIIADFPPVKEYFGDVYATTYKSEFVMLADSHRHRTLSYTINWDFDVPTEFYVPEILKTDKNLAAEWIKDITSRAKYIPIGTLFTVSEMGTLDNFILKLTERKCSCVQLDVNRNINVTLKKYHAALVKSKHPRTDELAQYMKGSRCTFPNYTCHAPCGFIEGINETRII